MLWNRVKIATNEQGIDPITGILLRCGVWGVEVESPRDFEEFFAQGGARWDYIDGELEKLKRNGGCCVKFYVTANEAGEKIVGEVRSQLDALSKRFDAGSLELTFSSLEEEDWSNAWKKYFKPFEVGERLCVVPEWEREKAAQKPARTALLINPGMAFGSGCHATTKLCLEALDSLVAGGESVLDLGCGSGILSIAARLLGAGDVVGVDIDPNARDVAEQNAALNGVSNCRFLSGDAASDERIGRQLGGKKDIIAANIVADVIIALLPLVGRTLKPEGRFIASGIIALRADEVIKKAEAAGFEVVKAAEDAGWSAVVFKFAQ